MIARAESAVRSTERAAAAMGEELPGGAAAPAQLAAYCRRRC